MTACDTTFFLFFSLSLTIHRQKLNQDLMLSEEKKDEAVEEQRNEKRQHIRMTANLMFRTVHLSFLVLSRFCHDDNANQ